MRAPACLLTACLSVLLSCGRTEPLRYQPDGSVDDVDGGADAGKVGCRNGVITLVPAVPKVMFVLDRSGSMSSFFGSIRTTRWSALTNALAAVLPAVDSKMEIGALVFPSGLGATCVVAGAPNLQPATNNVSPLVSLMRQVAPSGQTPTADAVKRAGEFLLSSKAATSARALVLATDGAPNCNPNLNPNTCVCVEANRCTDALMCLDDVASVAAIKGLATQNLPTYVIGIQDSDSVAIGVLNQMAIAGGRPASGTQAYYAVSSPDALTSALTTIRDQVANCTYLTSSVPTDDGSLILRVGGTLTVPYDPTGVEGWSWSNKDNGELVVRGTACQAIIAGNGTLTIDAQVTCSPDAGLNP